uniref:probable LRR receptor-like serine/threonine-protein kinase At3g47570 n=1 Tax=Erigeron canadensis TaxID=72917 RepID=UPI001CB9700A|nr:probable LRR receptor-like serine/threonine-protein kinase At3g47570 [Erigeron canadensis]
MANMCHPHTPYLVLSCIVFCWFISSVTSADFENETDRLALLSVKSYIRSDPYQILPSWNDSIHFCNWTGIICGLRRKRAVTLNLWSGAFSGSISPAVGNLSFLRELLLYNNSFTGNLPQEVGRLSRLRRLGISNNDLSGEIPSNISQCLNLVELDLSGNGFIGTIPNEFESLNKLQFLNLHSNNLTGEIPKFIGNFTNLTFISGLGNNFHGSIPNTLGRLSNLWFFGFAENNLSGTLPPSFFNLSSLTNIDLPDNQIGGNLPADIGQRFPGLVFLNLPINKFTGPIPDSLSNASNLEVLALNENSFTGSVPSFDWLTRLTWFAVNNNDLGFGKSDDLNFVSSLANCTRLTSLGFGANNLGGVLPKLVFNFTQLTELTIGRNLISGNIPSEIGQLVNVERLFLFSNQLSGTIPSSIGNLRNVGAMSLRGNLLSGFIPSSLGNLTLLSRLFLQYNRLEGTVPSSLSKCKGLQLLDLSRNNLSGSIPKEIFSLSSLTISLDLSDNQFVGSLPSEVGVLKNLVSFNISNNMMSGLIPSSLGSCTSLAVLSISRNTIQGEIPGTFNSLRGLEVLDLSHNSLTGNIPDYLGEFVFLESINLSFNSFEGKLPEEGAFQNISKVSIEGNAKLCGGLREFQLPKCSFEESSKNNKLPLSLIIIIPILCVIFILALILIFYLILKRRYSKKVSAGTSSDNEKLQLSYRILHEATNGFSLENLVGSGKFSSVYKAILYQKNGPEVVAVKVLKLEVRGAEKSFIAECEALRSIRHRNLVKIITACSALDYQGNAFKALVYPYMINGSLEDWLHNYPLVGPENESSRCLNFLERLNILIDVACALNYIHQHCGSPMVHCDIKPSNVLLDADMVAHLGDFGLARLLQQATHVSSTSHASSLGIKGTIGYAAPEYGMGSKTSPSGDIYSFGILILELFTCKRPTNDIFSNNLNLHDFVKMAIPHQVMEITDPALFQSKQEENMTKDTHDCKTHVPIEDCLISVYRIGIACSVEIPRQRTAINNVIDQLKLVKETMTAA